MNVNHGKSLRVFVSAMFAKRLENAVSARRIAPSKPLISQSQAIREAISEWLDRQAA